MAVTAAPPTDATNAELIRWAFDQLNRHDVTPLKAFWDDTTLERFPDQTCRGADEIAAYFENVFAGVPDFRMEIRSLVAEGDDVFVQWHMTGTHSGPLFGVVPTGKPLAVDGIDHFVVRDGRVVSNFVVFDQMQFAQQIGLMPPADSAGEKGLKALFNARTKVLQKVRSR
jgi:steroid delta-isomerase-like uncharacterized protein